MAENETGAPPLAVAAAVVAVSTWGLSTIVAKDIDMGGVAIGAYRFTIYALLASAFFALRGKRVDGRILKESFWGGLMLGADVAFFFSAVKLTAIANATVIGALQPVVVAFVAWRLFGERITARVAVLGLIAIGGVGVIILAAADSGESDLLGDLLAVGALFTWAGYFVFSKRAKSRMTSGEYTLGASLWAGLINIPVAVAFGQSLAWPDLRSWLGILVIAIGAGVFGHAMMNWAIQEIPLWMSSTLTLLIPVISAVGAWIVLGESLNAIQVAAMVVVLLALVGVVTSHRRPQGAATDRGTLAVVPDGEPARRRHRGTDGTQPLNPTSTS